MRVTIKINGVDTEIELTEKQVASIEEQKKPKKFEMKYEKSNTCFIDTAHIECHGVDETLIEYGRYRKTKESAELSFARNQRANRLEALVDQLDGMKEWICGEENFNVYYENNEFTYGNSKYIYEPDKVYMTEDCAIKVCEILNAGEYKL